MKQIQIKDIEDVCNEQIKQVKTYFKMLEENYENQEVIKILREFFEDKEIKCNYCELYELLESHLL